MSESGGKDDGGKKQQQQQQHSAARNIGGGDGRRGDGGSGGGDDESSDDRRSPRSPRFVNPEQFGRSPDVYVTLEKLMEAQEAFNNLVLAHEVATDDNFRFEPPAAAAASDAAAGAPAAATSAIATDDELERHVREIMHRAFWDLLAEQLARQPPDYSQALTLIGEIKTMLLSLLLPQHERVRQQIEEVLDLDLLKQKVEHEAFDIGYYSNYVLGVMARMCAPARDDAIRACAEIREPVALFKEVFRLLELMKVDMANFTVAQMRPYIRQQAVAYERAKFDQLLATQSAVGVDGLRRTRAWLAETAASVPAPERSPSRVVGEALLRLVDWRLAPLGDDRWPETLVVDASRVADIRSQLARLHCAAACVLVAMGVLAQRLPEERRAAFKARAKTAALAVLLAPSNSPDTTEASLAEQAAGLADTLAKAAESGEQHRVNDKELQLLRGQLADLRLHPAAGLLHARLMAFLRESLVESHARPVQLPPGYSAVEAELAQAAGAFLRLCAHNRAVFGRLYDQLLAVEEGQERSAAPAAAAAAAADEGGQK